MGLSGCLQKLGNRENAARYKEWIIVSVHSGSEMWVLPLLTTASLEALSYPWKDSAN